MISPTADVAPTARVALSASVWDLVQIREHAVIGEETSIGRGAYVGPGVVVGSRCKLQNYVQLHDPAHLADGVFVGPGAILTNDKNPRAVDPDMSRKGGADWNPVGVRVAQGASIGAGAICVAPVTIGEWAMVGAGSVVTRDVLPHSLVLGSPARHVGWVCACGHKLNATSTPGPLVGVCPSCKRRWPLHLST